MYIYIDNHKNTKFIHLILSCRSLLNCSTITYEVRGHGVTEGMAHFLSSNESRSWIAGGATSSNPTFAKEYGVVKINLQIFCHKEHGQNFTIKMLNLLLNY